MSRREVPPLPSEMVSEEEGRRRMKALTRRGLLAGGAGLAAVAVTWRWLTTAPDANGIPAPLRRVLGVNEDISGAAFSDARQTPAFSASDAREIRVNGMEGMDEEFNPATWSLTVGGLAAGTQTLKIQDVRALPRRDLIAEFKCIEGWSVVVHWAGIRFADFAARYPPRTASGRPADLGRPDDLPPYVAMQTPSEEYYVGLDRQSMLHPQTLLAYEMNGAPLAVAHGAPLRLVIPVKYGIKNIKRVGRIDWTFERPDDYWAERGYDWFAGL